MKSMPLHISRRLLVVLVVVVGASAFLVVPRTILAPTCTGSTDAEFGGRGSVPLCAITVETHATGVVSLAVTATMPGWGPYGAGSELTAFRLSVARYSPTEASTGFGSIDVRPELPRIFFSDAPTYDWSGPCRLEPAGESLLVSCAFHAESGNGTLDLRARIPAPPDPATDSRFRRIEFSYEMTGGRTAAGVATAIFERLPDSGDVVALRLSDDSVLVLGLGPASVGSTRVAFPGQPGSDGGYEGPATEGDIVFERCTTSSRPDGSSGTASCTGGLQERPSAPGSPVSLEVSWRVLP